MESSAQSQDFSGNDPQGNQPDPQDTQNTQDGGQEDYSTHIEELRNQLAAERQQNSQLRQQFGQTQQTIERVQKAFSGKPEKEVDPIDTEIAEAEAMLDHFLAEAVKAERAGIQMPLTILNGTKTAQLALKYLNDKKAASARLSKLEQQVQRQGDPNFVSDERAFSSIEGMLDEAINQVYPEDPRVADAQYNAVLKLVGDEIKDLKTKEPAKWAQVRRNPQLQRRLVQHFVHQSLPPRVRQMLEEKQLMETEQPVTELKEAFDEASTRARKALNDGNQDEYYKWSNIATEIRQQMIGSMMGEAKQGRRSSLNQVLGAYQRHQ